MVKAQLRRQRSGRLKYSEEVIGIPGNSKRDLLLADFLLFPACFGAWVGSTPFPLFQRVILAPVCGRAYSRPATLYFPTHKINGRIAELHLGFSLSVFMPNLSKHKSDKYSLRFSLNERRLCSTTDIHHRQEALSAFPF